MVDLMEEYRAKLLDYLADYDEDFMMQVLEGEEPSIEEIKRVLLYVMVTSSQYYVDLHIRTKVFN